MRVTSSHVDVDVVLGHDRDHYDRDRRGNDDRERSKSIPSVAR